MRGKDTMLMEEKRRWKRGGINKRGRRKMMEER